MAMLFLLLVACGQLPAGTLPIKYPAPYPIAIIFVIVKFFPDIMLFAVKAAVVVSGLYFLVGGLLWIFGASIAFNINTQLMGI